MPVTLSETWTQLSAQYETALARCADAAAAVEALPVAFDSAAERRQVEALTELGACERGLLAAVPPDLAAAAFQLKIFASHYHHADIEGERSTGEDCEGAFLRRFYATLSTFAFAGVPSRSVKPSDAGRPTVK